MRVIETLNVDRAYYKLMIELINLHPERLGPYWERADSRNGSVIRSTTPVATVYTYPWQRVLFNEIRDANPFFHVMEGLWIIAGREDVEWISHFNKNIANYSDDGEVFNGAYGARLRQPLSPWMPFDQVQEAIKHLIEYPESRRCVMAIWDVMDLKHQNTKDLPCNTHVYLNIRNGNLNMTICNRSNDIIWGAYGANAVHFSMLQEYIAACTDYGIGTYTHFSNDFHVYEDNPSWMKHMELRTIAVPRTYQEKKFSHIPLVLEPHVFDDELQTFMRPDYFGFFYTEPFLRDVAVPMRRAWDMYKQGGEWSDVLYFVKDIAAGDWKLACYQWMRRRFNK